MITIYMVLAKNSPNDASFRPYFFKSIDLLIQARSLKEYNILIFDPVFEVTQLKFPDDFDFSTAGWNFADELIEANIFKQHETIKFNVLNPVHSFKEQSDFQRELARNIHEKYPNLSSLSKNGSQK